MDLGKQIKALRQSRGLTQEQLAEKMDVSVQTISRWEKSVNYPDITMLPILASFFNVTTDYLLCVNEDNGDKSDPKLLKTVGTFEVKSRKDAQAMVECLKKCTRPALKDYSITEENSKVLLVVTRVYAE